MNQPDTTFQPLFPDHLRNLLHTELWLRHTWKGLVDIGIQPNEHPFNPSLICALFGFDDEWLNLEEMFDAHSTNGPTSEAIDALWSDLAELARKDRLGLLPRDSKSYYEEMRQIQERNRLNVPG